MSFKLSYLNLDINEWPWNMQEKFLELNTIIKFKNLISEAFRY